MLPRSPGRSVEAFLESNPVSCQPILGPYTNHLEGTLDEKIHGCRGGRMPPPRGRSM